MNLVLFAILPVMFFAFMMKYTERSTRDTFALIQQCDKTVYLGALMNLDTSFQPKSSLLLILSTCL